MNYEEQRKICVLSSLIFMIYRPITDLSLSVSMFDDVKTFETVFIFR